MKPGDLAGILLASAAIGLPTATARADEGSGSTASLFSANVSLMSNYVFRGMTYTQNRPALQGGFDYAGENGLYAGVFGTNVSPKAINEAGFELDFYGGYARSLGEWSIDVGLLQFYYPEKPRLAGTNEKYQTLEAYGAVGWRQYKIKYSTTLTDFFGFNSASMGDGGGRSRGSGYLELSASFDLPQDLNLSMHVGRQWVRNYGDYDYTDWRATLARSFGAGWTAMLTYTGTNADKSLWTADGKRLGATHWIVGLKRSF